MQAADIMTTNVISVGPDTTVQEVAQILLEKHISAVPVVGENERLLGIVSEGDLVRRVETGTAPGKSWWLALFTGTADRQAQFVKTHGRRASDVMTPDPVTVEPGTPLDKVARTLEAHRIKRVPVVFNGRMVGIVSRANLLHGLASAGPADAAATVDDRAIRDAILETISDELGVSSVYVNVIVRNGVVELWGSVDNDAKAHAIVVAAETTEGVKRVVNHIGRVPNWAYSV